MESENGPVESDQPNEPGNAGAPRITPERVADVALGMGATAFDWLEKAAKGVDDAVRRIVDDAPTVIVELEERGRPVREKIGEWLPGRHGGAEGSADAEAAARGAEDDIALLEARVRELEQQVPAPAPIEVPDIGDPAAPEITATTALPTDPSDAIPTTTEATPTPGPDDAPASSPDALA